MDEPVTVPTASSVEAYLAAIDDDQQRGDSETLVRLMQEVTREPPVMWGSGIVGFGSMHYKYASGREGDTMAVGFAARKQSLVLYGVVYYDQNLDSIDALGKHKLGKGCLYVKRLSDIDLDVLRTMVATAYAQRSGTS
jgi:hypothetical protein